MHPLCLDFLTAVEASPPELAALAAVNGLGLIAIMVHPADGVPEFGMASDTPMRRDTRQRCRDLGVRIDMIEGFLLKPDTDVAAFRASLESGAWLEAQCVNVLLRDPDLDRLGDTLSAFCDLAGECGLPVVTEWSRRTPLPSPAEAAAFLAATHPGIRLQFDSLHLFRAGFSASDLAALDPRIVGRAQLSDGPTDMPVERQFEEALGERSVPGDGQLPLEAFVSALPDGTVIGIEVPITSLRDQGIGPAERVGRAVSATHALLTCLIENP
jgi:sugar phosphate isomerase/epimerase